MTTTMLLDYPPLVAGQEVEFVEWMPGDKVGIRDMEGKAYQVDASHVSADFKRGPGRPRFDPDAPTARTAIRLTQAQLAKASELGNGNVSAGVRLAIEAAGEPAKESAMKTETGFFIPLGGGEPVAAEWRLGEDNEIAEYLRDLDAGEPAKEG